ncbi:MAG: TlpA disulfide reductase family protein [Methylococcales bacterium]|nr:TlpA disulfide reductase family protein [Methylococcales bacterium]MDD5215609.1 TlpA disulfide reductase family protein [Methylococcales bacterium]
MKTFLFLVSTLIFSNSHATAMGENSPDCVLTSLNNTPVHFHEYTGKVLYVDFWASWCTSCMQSFPFLNQLTHEFGEQGLHIVGVNLDEQVDDALAFLGHHPSHFTIANHGGEQCAKSFEVQAMPSSYLIDKHGVIRYTHQGFRAGETDELKQQIVKLLAEK